MRRLLVVCLIAGCFKSAHDPAVDRRLADIEAKLAEQDKAISELQNRTDSTELALLAQQIAELSAKVTELADKVAKAPAPRPNRQGRQPDPALTYAIPIGTSPSLGSPKAKVTMVMAFEFACPYCRKAWDTVGDLEKKYGTNLRVVFKQFVVHPSKATAPAYAACAAGKQNKFTKLAELMWKKAFDANDFDPQNIYAIAKAAGLDMQRYANDVAGTCMQEIKDDQRLLQKFAVNATPTFFINGRFMAGAQPQENFEALIDEEMAKADEAIKKGTKPERYYEDVILGSGVPEVPATP
jgi:protein-disulfide isomerase